MGQHVGGSERNKVSQPCVQYRTSNNINTDVWLIEMLLRSQPFTGLQARVLALLWLLSSFCSSSGDVNEVLAITTVDQMGLHHRYAEECGEVQRQRLWQPYLQWAAAHPGRPAKETRG